ncbi:flippase [Candidatus Uhrbacteria bacterium]|jgi:O-antigen/teichoic acid export membrane protein|nr:flippase [Candidatus Uhrbacteria bacterium]MBT7717412.1 flippase [Candidatus Uhrbacteria bacterium]
MSSGTRLAQNTLYLTLASVGQKTVAFLYFTMIARFIGVEDTGAYFLALAIVMIILVLDDIGMTSVLIREVARKNDDAQLWSRTILGVKVITIPITVAIAFILPEVLNYSDTVVTLVRIATIILVADTISLSFYGVLRGLHKLKYEALGLFAGQIITAVVGVTLLLSGVATLPLLVFALATGSIWNMLFSASRVIKHTGWRAMVPTWQMGWKPIKMASAFFMAAAFVKVYSYADSVLLERIMDESAVGLYAVAYKMTYAFQFIPLAFVAALYPTMSAHSKNPAELKRILLNAFWYVSLIGAPIVFGIWAVAPEVIELFYGAEFAGSALPLQVLIFVLIFIFLDFPIGSLLNATDKQVTKMGIMGVTMVINVVANIFLIPLYGIVGACIAALISFTFMFVAGWIFACPAVKVRVSDLVKSTYKIYLSAIVMAVVVVLVKPIGSILVSIPLGGIVYVALIFASGAIRKDHISAGWSMLTKRG